MVPLISKRRRPWGKRKRAEVAFETVCGILKAEGDSVTDPEIPVLVNQQTAQWLCVVARANFTFPL